MMKKCISTLLLAIILLCLLLPASAAQEPTITRQLQNPTFPEYALAEYSVTVYGENLKCTWYLEYEGKTYNLSDTSGSAEPWEAYAGETYGPQESQNGSSATFTYFFSGIELPLDGAVIYPVIADGHFELYGDSAVIRVSDVGAMPPKIAVPASMEIRQNEMLELYCEAGSPNGGELSYLWYETATGKLQDIIAINRGFEVFDTLRCDTYSVGTRFYVCQVTTEEGGMAYSSVIPVTVIAKDAIDPPVIETTSLPNGKIGEKYSVKLDCTDSDAVFSIYKDPDNPNEFKKTGLSLTKQGELEGTPKKAGTYQFTVMVSNDGGDGHQCYTLTITDGKEPTMELIELPDKLEYYTGEKLDLTGLKVTIQENGKSFESIDGDKLSFSTEAFTTLGEQTVHITYKEATASFTVMVEEVPAPTTTETEPTTTQEDNKEPTDPVEEQTNPSQTATPDEPAPQKMGRGVPWWGVLLISLGSAGFGGGVVFLVMKKKMDA